MKNTLEHVWSLAFGLQTPLFRLYFAPKNLIMLWHNSGFWTSSKQKTDSFRLEAQTPKMLLFLLFTLSLLFSACTIDSVDSPAFIKKKGEEGPLIQRYMKDLVSNPGNQDQTDRNLIVNLLIDSLWDFQKTASGIYYQIEAPGTGGSPNLNSNIVCHYRGTLMDGKEFDSSYKRGKPLEFNLGGVIAGWQESIPMLQKGGKGIFIVPSRSAYGSKGMGSLIKPNTVLIFDVELVDFQ
ncbi:MAG: hypothetical protein ACI8P3_001732 [Saprospiraceae bacterium]|jgi:hypothetical protein